MLGLGLKHTESNYSHKVLIQKNVVNKISPCLFFETYHFEYIRKNFCTSVAATAFG